MNHPDGFLHFVTLMDLVTVPLLLFTEHRAVALGLAGAGTCC